MSEYEKDRHINLNQLEFECLKQPELFHKWGKQWAIACKKRDLLHEKIKTIRSKILENLRKNWSDLGFDKKPAAGEAEAYYRIQPEYIKYKQKWVRADADSRILFIAMRSMEHKKDMVEVKPNQK